jgi:hypothetical protein
MIQLGGGFKENRNSEDRPRPKRAEERPETAIDIKSRLVPEGIYVEEKIILKNIFNTYKMSVR